MSYSDVSGMLLLVFVKKLSQFYLFIFLAWFASVFPLPVDKIVLIQLFVEETNNKAGTA